MIKNQRINHLLKKHALNACTKEEKQELIDFFKSNSIEDINSMPSVEEINELVGSEFFDIDEDTSINIYKNIIRPVKRKRVNAASKKNKSIKGFLKIAAIFTGFILIGVLYNKNNNLTNLNIDTDNLPQNQITLQLENGEVKVIDTEITQDLTDMKGSVIGKQEKSSISYSNAAEIETLTYNTLNIPYGKTFKLLLSDGTIVFLNAGTSLKYPVKFLEGYKREVYLEGEAYFDVVKDKKHQFVVNNNGVNVEVYGTKFNVSTYPEDDLTDVVLVEGSVGMYKTDSIPSVQEQSKVMLTPGIKGSFDKQHKTIETKSVITSIYTSWINGELVFRDMAFENILKKFERRYDVSIKINNDAFAKEIFNASFTDEPIEKVLEYLSMTYDINYTINNKQIIIN